MMGMPFYGQKIDFKVANREAIINKQYIEILEKQQVQLSWNQKFKECVMQYVDSSTGAPNYVVYPCLKFIKTRLDLFDEFEVGAFIWEAGQGLEYFYELL
jgi:chitinase domain-containing protein 1